MSEAKTVFITGGSRGIGRAVACRFAREGYKIVITYQTGRDEAQAVASECETLGSPETLVLRLDLTEDQSIQEAAKQVKQKYGRIDILVNNAGVMRKGALRELEFADIHRQVAVNLEGLMKLTKEFLPFVEGAVINIGSGVGFVGKKQVAVYTATKWAVRGFTKSLAKEAPTLRVLAVHPGHTATAMGKFQGMPPETVARVIYEAAAGEYKLPSGADILVRHYCYGRAFRPFLAAYDFLKRVL